jgi:hypothetical protein
MAKGAATDRVSSHELWTCSEVFSCRNKFICKSPFCELNVKGLLNYLISRFWKEYCLSSPPMFCFWIKPIWINTTGRLYLIFLIMELSIFFLFLKMFFSCYNYLFSVACKKSRCEECGILVQDDLILSSVATTIQCYSTQGAFRTNNISLINVVLTGG